MNRGFLLAMLGLFCGVATFGPPSDSAQAQTVVGEGLTAEQVEIIEALPVVAPNLNRGYSLVRESGKSVRATLGLRVTASSLEAEQWVFVLPVPPSLPGQEVLDARAQPPGELIADQSALQRPVRRCVIPARNASQKQNAGVTAQYDLRLYSRTLHFDQRPGHSSRLRPKKPEQIDQHTRYLFLRPSEECDYSNDAFQDWKLRQGFQRERREGEVKFAQRVFQKLATDYGYLYVPQQNRKASALCEESKTDCGGLSTLFVSVMRSEGIPARVLVGRWAQSARPGETVDGQRYYQYHVIAEFFAQNIGWVPVDPASAVLHDRSKTKLRFFARDPGNFITLHVDTGVTVDTLLYGDYRAAYLQVPLFWARGTGNLDDPKLDEIWRVSTVATNSRNTPLMRRGGR